MTGVKYSRHYLICYSDQEKETNNKRLLDMKNELTSFDKVQKEHIKNSHLRDKLMGINEDIMSMNNISPKREIVNYIIPLGYSYLGSESGQGIYILQKKQKKTILLK